MSRFDNDGFEDEWWPNQAALWAANADRALRGKRGRKALADLREALRALPEKRLIEGALCTVGERHDVQGTWSERELADKVQYDGTGVCAIGAFLWHKRVKAGEDPEKVFADLPTLLDVDDGGWRTAEIGRDDGGLTYTLASTLAWRNDSVYEDVTPEERYVKFMTWLDAELAA